MSINHSQSVVVNVYGLRNTATLDAPTVEDPIRARDSCSAVAWGPRSLPPLISIVCSLCKLSQCDASEFTEYNS